MLAQKQLLLVLVDLVVLVDLEEVMVAPVEWIQFMLQVVEAVMVDLVRQVVVLNSMAVQDQQQDLVVDQIIQIPPLLVGEIQVEEEKVETLGLVVVAVVQEEQVQQLIQVEEVQEVLVYPIV